MKTKKVKNLPEGVEVISKTATLYTPGPWRCTHIGTQAAPNNLVHSFEVYTSPEGEHSNLIGSANAELIAKAWLLPELAQALKDLANQEAPRIHKLNVKRHFSEKVVLAQAFKILHKLIEA